MGVKLIAKHRHTHYAGAWVPYTLIHLIDYLLVYLFDGTERKIGKKRRRRATNTFEAEVRDTPITGTQRGGHVTETGSFIPWKLLIFIGPPGRWHVRRSLTNGARAPLPNAKNKGRREKRKIRDTFSKKSRRPRWDRFHVPTTDFMKDDKAKAEEIAQFVQSNRERVVIAI